MANREDPDQAASSEAVWSGSALFHGCLGLLDRQLVLKILEHLLYIIGMTWIENIEEATFAIEKRMFELNSLPCTCGNHVCRPLITVDQGLSLEEIVVTCT